MTNSAFKLAVFDAKQYDEDYFTKYNYPYNIKITYFKEKLTFKTKEFAKGFDGVCVFVNDDVDQATIKYLHQNGVKLITTRSAGFNQIDIAEAKKLNIPVLRVPAYSPNAVAEFAATLVLTLLRKTHLAYQRTTKYNFSLVGLLGSNVNEKIVGVIGTGKIGKIFAQIMLGFGAKVIAYDVMPDQAWAQNYHIQYVSLDKLYEEAEIISLHSPLTTESYHLINHRAIQKMKDNVIIINTSRGPIVDTLAIVDGLENAKIKGVALDVYEDESAYFFEDYSQKGIKDIVLKRLLKFDNAIITSHSAFFTKEALQVIYETTINNIGAFINHQDLKNIVV